jgi:hypothetical protein
LIPHHLRARLIAHERRVRLGHVQQQNAGAFIPGQLARDLEHALRHRRKIHGREQVHQGALSVTSQFPAGAPSR